MNKKYISRGVWKTEISFESTAERSTIALWDIAMLRYLDIEKKTSMQHNFQTWNKSSLTNPKEKACNSC